MSPFRVLWALLVSGLSLCWIAPVQAQNVSATNPASVADVIRAKGYQIEITKDAGGDPMIRATGKGYRFTVLFYGCTANKDCQTIGFYASWAGEKSDLARINDWNRTQRFGRAYLDKEAIPSVEMDVDLDDSGMSRLLFEDNVEFWMSVMVSFAKFVIDE